MTAHRDRSRVLCAPIQPGNVQVHWPEGSILIARHTRSPQAGIPDYNAVVRIDVSRVANDAER